ncbi:MAG: hypothetical protein C4523_13415 [Myxococcales bacterium]|nr:MAG: hypothetical protein C4523_13415 [Myxococcales bacterium]
MPRGRLTALALLLFAFALLNSCSHKPPRDESWRRMVLYPGDMGVQVVWRAQVTERDLADYLEYEPLEDGIAGVSADAVFVGGRSKTLYKLDRRTGERLGKRKLDEEIFSQPLVGGGMVYLGTSSGVFYALREDNLQDAWTYDSKSEIVAPPTLHEGIVYFITQEDVVTALDAQSGKFLWEYRQDYLTTMIIRRHARPVVDGDHLYQGFTNGTMCALDRLSGNVAWCRSLTEKGGRFEDVNATPAIANGFLYTASFDNGVYCLNADSGVVVWRQDIKSASAPLLIGDTLFVTASEDGLYGLDVETGAIAAHFEIQKLHHGREEGALSQPFLYSDRYFVFSASGSGVYFFDYRDQRFIERFTPGNGVSAPPTTAGQTVFTLSNGGYVYAIALARKAIPPRRP